MGFRQVNKIPWKSLGNAFQTSWSKAGKSLQKDKAKDLPCCWHAWWTEYIKSTSSPIHLNTMKELVKATHHVDLKWETACLHLAWQKAWFNFRFLLTTPCLPSKHWQAITVQRMKTFPFFRKGGELMELRVYETCSICAFFVICCSPSLWHERICLDSYL